MGQPPPLPFRLFRPSHAESMVFSTFSTYIASTHAVSRSVFEPVPQLSSGPVNVVLVEAFWQVIVGWFGSVMEYVVPECVVGIERLLPSHAELPVPSATRSLAWRTRPLRASMTTSLIEGMTPWWPVTRVSQPSRERAPCCHTTRCGRVLAVACGTWCRAVRTAVARATFGSIDLRWTRWVCATEVVRIWPCESVTTTK